MARQSGTLIQNGEGYAQYSYTSVVDLRNGGQNGAIPDYRTFISNSAYVQRNVIPFLIEYPRGFDYMPGANGRVGEKGGRNIWVGTLKALVETQAKSIEGLNGTLSVNFVDNPIGSSGEVQEDYSQTQRARSTPSFTWVERQGRPVYHFFKGWIDYLLGHAETQTPMLGSVPGNEGVAFDFLPDMTSMTVLFVEPDPYQRRVVESWLCINMMPHGAGELNGKRDLTSAMSGREVSVEFTAITMMSQGVNEFAQRLLNELNLTGMNPQLRKACVDKVDAAISAVTGPNGQDKVGYGVQVRQNSAQGLNYNYDNSTGMAGNPADQGKNLTYENGDVEKAGPWDSHEHPSPIYETVLSKGN